MDHLPPELEPFARKIAASKLPHVDVRPVVGPTTPWQSKLRGVPYYPKDMAWPLDIEGKPLVMLVQINFEEMPTLPNYPEKGILQLYVSADYVPSLRTMCPKSRCGECETTMSTIQSKGVSLIKVTFARSTFLEFRMTPTT
jgi:hypothetical protein